MKQEQRKLTPCLLPLVQECLKEGLRVMVYDTAYNGWIEQVFVTDGMYIATFCRRNSRTVSIGTVQKPNAHSGTGFEYCNNDERPVTVQDVLDAMRCTIPTGFPFGQHIKHVKKYLDWEEFAERSSWNWYPIMDVQLQGDVEA